MRKALTAPCIDEATESVRVSFPVRMRECKGATAPGEVPVKLFSDGGSTPPASTMKKHTFVYRTKVCFFNDIRSLRSRVIYLSV